MDAQSTHPYFTAKAREVLARAGGDPDAAGALAAWAQVTKQMQTRDVGVIVAADGAIVAHTAHVRGGAGGASAHYVTTTTAAIRPLDVREVGLCLGIIARAIGQDVIHVKASQVTSGASRFIKAL